MKRIVSRNIADFGLKMCCYRLLLLLQCVHMIKNTVISGRRLQSVIAYTLYGSNDFLRFETDSIVSLLRTNSRSKSSNSKVVGITNRFWLDVFEKVLKASRKSFDALFTFAEEDRRARASVKLIRASRGWRRRGQAQRKWEQGMEWEKKTATREKHFNCKMIRWHFHHTHSWKHMAPSDWGTNWTPTPPRTPLLLTYYKLFESKQIPPPSQKKKKKKIEWK